MSMQKWGSSHSWNRRTVAGKLLSRTLFTLNLVALPNSNPTIVIDLRHLQVFVDRQRAISPTTSSSSSPVDLELTFPAKECLAIARDSFLSFSSL